MSESVTVHFDLSTVPGMHRHRVSVWNEDGGLLRPASAEVPADLTVDDGDTFVVEASTPIENKRKPTTDRDEARWRLRARRNSHAVLELGKSRFNKNGVAVAITIEGAEQIRKEARLPDVSGHPAAPRPRLTLVKPYRLLGPDGFYDSATPGELGGNSKSRIYGRLDCRSPKVGLAKGTYQQHRVFFADESTAVAAGYRPCGKCMRGPAA